MTDSNKSEQHPRAGWAATIDSALAKGEDGAIDHQWLDAVLVRDNGEVKMPQVEQSSEL